MLIFYFENECWYVFIFKIFGYLFRVVYYFVMEYDEFFDKGCIKIV